MLLYLGQEKGQGKTSEMSWKGKAEEAEVKICGIMTSCKKKVGGRATIPEGSEDNDDTRRRERRSKDKEES